MGPGDPATGATVGTDVATQARQTLQNIQAILSMHGLDLGDVVKTTVHLAELKRDFGEFDAAYCELVPEPRPARTTVGSQRYNILVEIDVVAAQRRSHQAVCDRTSPVPQPERGHRDVAVMAGTLHIAVRLAAARKRTARPAVPA